MLMFISIRARQRTEAGNAFDAIFACVHSHCDANAGVIKATFANL